MDCGRGIVAGKFTSADFQQAFDVSRETFERLEAYVAHLTKWQRALNLVSTRSLDDVWNRHIRDCAQLAVLAPGEATEWTDLGSGAGLPGLILSILGVGHVRLIESDAKKCAFLREAIRVTDATAEVVEGRIEDVGGRFGVNAVYGCPDTITARAVAPLAKLLDWAFPLCGPDTVCLFPKGQDVVSELTATAKYPNITVDKLPSVTSRDSVILRITGLGYDNSG